jgi:hypothetical protein
VLREAYAHDAVAALQAGDSPNALGGAITIALCGSWDHPPPCPLAPHYVSYLRDGEIVTLRILFAAEPDSERRVRSLIDEALAAEESWQLRSTAPGNVRPDERDHAAHLIAHGLDDR